ICEERASQTDSGFRAIGATMASGSRANAAEIDRLATTLAKDPASKAFIPLAEEYGKAGMWAEAAGVLEDGLKYYPGFITAMVALGRAYDQLSQPTKAKAILEEAIKISPENLRAHRTLAKIYTAEGSTAQALRSCDVILTLNPLDQESLSLRTSLGASVQATSTTPKTPSAMTAPAAVVAPPPPPPAIAEMSAPEPKTAVRDVVADATEMVTAALETSQIQTEEPTTVDAQAMSDAAAPQTPSSSSSRNQATTSKLEHLLQSITARRRDRPSPEAAASASSS
ncbi:MAG: tetratricopeptide repeat protein, partial [Nitrospira sp.]